MASSGPPNRSQRRLWRKKRVPNGNPQPADSSANWGNQMIRPVSRLGGSLSPRKWTNPTEKGRRRGASEGKTRRSLAAPPGWAPRLPAEAKGPKRGGLKSELRFRLFPVTAQCTGPARLGCAGFSTSARCGAWPLRSSGYRRLFPPPPESDESQTEFQRYR